MSQSPLFADTAFWIALFLRSETVLVTTEAICWEWMNAMSGAATRSIAAQAYGFCQILHP